ncbi:incFII family plasmid replication initiator RepA [Salmonella enterica subsp. enterica serovar Infantis]|nr:incFII family plasmid replication initiator RepA [Salmonella enterica subsp. enterica serovar Infantis]EGI5923375.1 incFII family plasmid replication initiator RepA [Salmonella enterica subsp. enterica serovar Colindale]
MVTDSTHKSPYRQVKNPNPVFIPGTDKNGKPKETLSFCQKLMQKAANFTSRFDFDMLVAFARARGWRKRKPPRLRRDAIDALLPALCFHYDPLANRVNASITTMAMECSLATESEAGNLSITRATRALKFLAFDLELLTYNTEYDADIGCNIPTDITFKPLLFKVLDISEESVAAARKSRAEWQNRQREKNGLSRLGIEELIGQAWRFVRECFRDTKLKHKEHGLKRARAKKDAERDRQEIKMIVHRQLTREIAAGRFPDDYELIKAEVEKRVKERMVLSRGHSTRLGTPAPSPA